MKGDTTTTTVIFLILAFLIIGIFAYWFYTNYLKGKGQFDQATCQQIHLQACDQFKSAGYPDRMKTRVHCDPSMPPACNSAKERYPSKYNEYCTDEDIKNRVWKDVVPANISAWWDCIAPGCRVNYGIKIDDKNDCS